MITWREKTPSTCSHILNIFSVTDTIGKEYSWWNRFHIHTSLYFYRKVDYYYRKDDVVYVVFAGGCGSVIRYRNPYKEYLPRLKDELKNLEKQTREVDGLSSDQVLLYRNARSAHIRTVIRNLAEIFSIK